jgi:uncharacterized SAM-dependent methyltransferase
MSDELATHFISELSANLQEGLFFGVDLIKPASVVLPAYNDNQGLTAALILIYLTE